MTVYLGLFRNAVLERLAYRFHFFFMAISNCFIIVLTWFLWKAIYQNSHGKLNGMNFGHTFMYLALASSIFILFQNYTDWFMARDILSGNIVIDIIRPVDFQLRTLVRSLGGLFWNFVWVTLPTLIILLFVVRSEITFGLNVVYFLITLSLSYLISFNLDFMVGLTSFYNESIWGVSMIKEMLILTLSGAIVPLPFFPEPLQSFLSFSPFPAIYHTPLSILTTPNLDATKLLELMSVQLLWILVLFMISRFLFRQAVKVVTVNGG